MRGDGDWVEMKTRLLLSCCKGHLSLARKSAHAAGPARVPGRPPITWCMYRWGCFSGGVWTDLSLRDAHLPRQCGLGHEAAPPGRARSYAARGARALQRSRQGPKDAAARSVCDHRSFTPSQLFETLMKADVTNPDRAILRRWSGVTREIKTLRVRQGWGGREAGEVPEVPMHPHNLSSTVRLGHSRAPLSSPPVAPASAKRDVEASSAPLVWQVLERWRNQRQGTRVLDSIGPVGVAGVAAARPRAR